MGYCVSQFPKAAARLSVIPPYQSPVTRAVPFRPPNEGSFSNNQNPRSRSCSSSLASSGRPVPMPFRGPLATISHKGSDMMRPLAESLPSHPEIPPEATRPGLNPSERRMCVAVDFGTVLSGVACGLSSDTVEQILWPGSNRKVPTSLTYDAQGRVVAWGHRSQVIKLERGWIRCEMFKLLLNPNGASDIIPIFPPGKGLIDVITDYLCELWQV
ncbi:hypothetical protein BS47DRAFT_483365 [Hydnum rufescens UP504]|uniref:Uncharacterized protein n=1 Tax=Hydnum rufescens UP504 TaxID=1448309 RepID=A0A9P6AHG8_9AGAM|nr:hypothetical protein BS47DRAFT_483365 [Hydnum rufescens UP504]